MRIARASLLSIAVLILLVVFPVQAAEKTTVSATDYFDPLNFFDLLGSGAIGSFTPGTVNCSGYPEINSLPCPTGSQAMLRGFTFTAKVVSTDSRLNGWETFEYNSNGHADGETNSRGKWRIYPSGCDGYWEGNYVEKGNPPDSYGVGISTGKYELHGHGSLEGLLLKMDYLTTGYYGGIVFTSDYTGYILDPKAKQR